MNFKGPAALLTLALVMYMYSGCDGCLDEWSNECKKDGDCCSDFCEKKDKNWEFGVCKEDPSKATTKKFDPSHCLDNWDNTCKHNDECCSKTCDFEGHKDWVTGVCKP